MLKNSRLLDAHPETARLLERFEFESTAPLIAGLLIAPELHANTLRLQALILLASMACKGDKKAEPSDIQPLVSSLEKEHPYAYFEDPPEDVFTSYIATPAGGWIAFSGIFANGYFWLERLLIFLEGKTNLPTFSELFDENLALVKLADAVARRAGVERYASGGGESAGSITAPCEELVKSRSCALTFTDAELEAEGIDRSDLASFELKPEARASIIEQNVLGNSIEKHPIIFGENTTILLDPSNVCRAALHSILEGVSRVMGGWADTFFEKESAEFFVNDVIHMLEIEQITVDLPTAPKSLPPFLPYCGQFDYGKPVLAIVFTAKLSEGAQFDQPIKLTEEQVQEFEAYLESCCDALSTVEGFSGGMVLAGFATAGRDLYVGFNNLPDQWHFFGAGLCDWKNLRSESGFDAFHLWRLAKQMQRAEELDVEISNLSGLVNLYAYWKANGFTLIPREADVHQSANRLAIAPNYCHELNIELQRRPDAHCRKTHSGDRWTHLQRINNGWTPDYNENTIYGDITTARSGQLLGCSERSSTIWWVSCDAEATNPRSRSHKSKLWDCLLNWVDEAATVVQGVLPTDLPSILVQLRLPDIDTWSFETFPTPRGDSVTARPTVTIDVEKAIIDLSVPEAFLQVFHRAENDAERELVALLVDAATQLAGTSDSDLVDRMVERIIPDRDRRHFHVLKVKQLENILAAPGEANIRHVPPEDLNNVQLGLADAVGRLKKGDCSKKGKVTKFLTDVVTHLWESIESGLKGRNLGTVASLCFQQLDEIGCEKSRWQSTTRALLALHNKEPWIVDKIRDTREDLTLAEIANRLILETAMYSASKTSGVPVALSEHSELIAKVTAMLMFANHRDAIAGGFMSPSISIFPNGEIEVDHQFYDDVFSPYIQSSADDQITYSAENYEAYFEEDDDAGDKNTEPELSAAGKAFLRIFRAEFGFKFDVLGDVLEMFHDRAMQQRQSLIAVSSQDLKKRIAQASGISAQQATRFVERFTLPIRSGWDKNLGHHRIEDVFPWRHRRGLSILSRPIIHISDAPRMLLVSATHMHRWFRYFLNNLESGYFPAHHFKTKEMDQHLGEIANRKGHSFAKRVYEKCLRAGLDAGLEIQLTELGAPRKPDLGDIDVLAWNAQTGQVFLIECKRLKKALTPRDVIQRLDEFKGNEGDRLGKHVRRIEWIENNLDGLSAFTGISSDSMVMVPMLVTSDRVPMKFVSAINFPSDWVVPIQDLDDTVEA